MASASSQHSRFSDQGVLDLAREVPTTVYKMANGVVLDREHTLIRSDLDELAAGYLRLFEQLETLRAALVDIAAMPGPGKSGTGSMGWLTTHERAPKRAQEALDAVSFPASEPKEDQ